MAAPKEVRTEKWELPLPPPFGRGEEKENQVGFFLSLSSGYKIIILDITSVIIIIDAWIGYGLMI